MQVKRTKKGRGVYATQDYRKGEIVEKAHVIIFPRKEMAEESVLAYYQFEWVGSNYALALGNGSLYNHSYEPNLIYLAYPKGALMVFQTLRPVKVGEELTINYNGDPEDDSMVYFLDKKRATAARGK